MKLTKKDFWLGILAGTLIGLMFLPVLKVTKPLLYSQIRLIVIPFFIMAVPLGLLISQAISKKIAFVWQLGKFIVTGVLNVLIDFGVLSILIFFTKKYLSIESTDIIFNLGIVITFYSLYKAISFTVANINSYFWNKYWTFQKKKAGKSEFFQFFAVSIIGFVINVTTASIVFNLPHVLNTAQWGLVGAAAGSLLGLIWNFLGYKLLVFKK